MRVQHSFARRLSTTAFSCSSGTSSPSFMNSAHYRNTHVNKVNHFYVQDGSSVSICGFDVLLLFLVFGVVKLNLKLLFHVFQQINCAALYFIPSLAQYQMF